MPTPVRDFSADELTNYLIHESGSDLGPWDMQRAVEQQALDGKLTVWARRNQWGSVYEKLDAGVFAELEFDELAAWLTFEKHMPGKGRPTSAVGVARRVSKAIDRLLYVDPWFCKAEVLSLWPPRRVSDLDRLIKELSIVQRRMLSTLFEVSDGIMTYQDVIREFQEEGVHQRACHAERNRLKRLGLVWYEKGWMGLTDKGEQVGELLLKDTERNS